jgi:hypothetical protein
VATTENKEMASICPAGEAFPLPHDEDYKSRHRFKGEFKVSSP